VTQHVAGCAVPQQGGAAAHAASASHVQQRGASTARAQEGRLARLLQLHAAVVSRRAQEGKLVASCSCMQQWFPGERRRAG
jgi:hypothetical protein